MMKKLSIFVYSILFSAYCFSAEYTSEDKIGTVEYDGNGVNFYVSNSTGTGWGAPGCPTARYVLANPAMPGLKEFIAITLSAKMADKNIRFYGSCDPNSEHNFIAYYLTLF